MRPLFWYVGNKFEGLLNALSRAKGNQFVARRKKIASRVAGHYDFHAFIAHDVQPNNLPNFA
jgi:hypothetical protein